MKNVTETFELTGQQLLKEARSSDSSLIERAPIQGTPFEVVKEDGKWFAAFGYNKLTEDFDEMQDVLNWMEENHWELLVRVITMVVQTIDLHKMKMMKEAHDKRKNVHYPDGTTNADYQNSNRLGENVVDAIEGFDKN